MERRRHTLLIVDDEEDVLDSLRHLFRRQYRVLTASSAETALALIGQNDVHVILSDQRMPGMTGDVFLGRARQLAPEAVRMLFTGYADLQAVIVAVNQGNIFRYITKPWDADELVAIIRQAADQYELVAERNRLLVELRAANQRLTAANRELEETSQLKTAFLEVASHEFNTPINIIQGLSELLRLLNPQRSEPEREILEQITAGARQLARLVASTLKLMNAEDFRRTLRREPTDLPRLLRGVADHVMPFVHARRQHLRLEIDEDLGRFDVDADKVRDAVVNLLTNAIKFTPDAGQITLGARRTAADEAEITVADRGIGVEPRALERFFVPFFTEFDTAGHSSGDFGFQKRGLGLGLSLVKKFVELHGGRVLAQSAVNQGTRVTIVLPRCQSPAAAPELRPGTCQVEAGPDPRIPDRQGP
jgi:signal transduction histidine kinase